MATPIFSARQQVLFDRLRGLCERAENDHYPVKIITIWGGGSLFRLYPNPRDVDLWVETEPSTTEASLCFNHSFLALYELAEQRDFSISPQEALESLLGEKASDHSRFEELFSHWISGLTWPSVKYVICSTPKALIRRLCTKRLMEAEFPRLQILGFGKRSDCLKMKMTKIWSRDLPFDPQTIISAAPRHLEHDRATLVPDYHRLHKASEAFSEAVRSAAALRPRDIKGWPRAISKLRDRAEGLYESDEIDESPVSIPTQELRSRVKALRDRICCHRAVLPEIVTFKCRAWTRRARRRMFRGLEWHLAFVVFGSSGRQRTRKWLRILRNEGFDLAWQVDYLQRIRKGTSDVPKSLLE